MANDLALGVAWPDNVESAHRPGIRLARRVGGWVVEDRHIELAVGEKGAGVPLLNAQLEVPLDGAAIRVNRVEIAFLRDRVDRVPHKDGRAGRGGNVVRPEFKLLALQHHRTGGTVGRQHAGHFECNHLAQLVRGPIDRNDLVGMMDQHSGIDASSEQRHAPEGFAGPRVSAHHAAIAGAGEEDSQALIPAELRMRKRIVLRRRSGARGPDRLAGLFVEGIKPVGGRTLRAPIRRDPASDDQIRIHDRRSGAAVGKGQTPEFFHQRMLPKRFAFRGERREDALCALDEDVSCLRIDRGAGGCVTQINGVAQVIIIEMLPKLSPGIGFETRQSLLQIRALP